MTDSNTPSGGAVRDLAALRGSGGTIPHPGHERPGERHSGAFCDAVWESVIGTDLDGRTIQCGLKAGHPGKHFRFLDGEPGDGALSWGRR